MCVLWHVIVGLASQRLDNASSLKVERRLALKLVRTWRANQRRSWLGGVLGSPTEHQHGESPTRAGGWPGLHTPTPEAPTGRSPLQQPASDEAHPNTNLIGLVAFGHGKAVELIKEGDWRKQAPPLRHNLDISFEEEPEAEGEFLSEEAKATFNSLRDRLGLDSMAMEAVQRGIRNEEIIDEKRKFESQVKALTGKLKIANITTQGYQPTPKMDEYFAEQHGQSARAIIDEAARLYQPQMDVVEYSIRNSDKQPTKTLPEELQRSRAARQALYHKHFEAGAQADIVPHALIRSDLVVEREKEAGTYCPVPELAPPKEGEVGAV